MEYEKKDGEIVGKLKQKNVDTGAGVDRITAIMQKKQTAYDTDLLEGQLYKNKLRLAGESIEVSVKSYEIKTIRLESTLEKK